MKKKNTLLLLITPCILLLTTIPFFAKADKSGSCGDNLTWSYVDTTLTISGQGEMVIKNNAPWYSCFKTCTTVIIEDGITSIGHGAFSGFKGLTTVMIPDTVTTIKDYAFSGCSGLTEVTIPDSVKLIGGCAFQLCFNLETVSLGNGVTKIGNRAFGDCPALTSIVLPDSVTELGNWAFTDCRRLTSVTIGSGMQNLSVMAFEGCTALKSFTLSSTNPYLHADKGILYTKDKTTLLLAPKGFFGSYTVLPGTKTIGVRAFYECEKITSVILPDSVTVIEDYCFDFCKGLTSISLGNGLKTIGRSAFAFIDKLPNIRFPSALQEIGSLAFVGCSGLREFYFQGDFPKIGELAFRDLTATAYYPGNNATWKGMGLYGGIITWKAIDCNGNHTPAVIKGSAATCTKNGKTDGSSCSACGQILKAQQVIKAAHSYGSWITTVTPTAQAAGTAVRTCSLCGATEEKALNKLENVTTPEADATQPGTTTDPQIPDSSAGDPTPPSQTDAADSTASSIPTQTEDLPTDTGDHKDRSWVLIWLSIGIFIAADTVVGVIYLKNRKKK